MQGREKEAVVISLVRSNNTVRPVFSTFLHFGSDLINLIQRDVGFLKEKKRMNGVCAEGSVNSMSAISYFIYSGYDTSKTASCKFFFWSSITSSILIEHFSVLLEIPRPSAMGVNISRNG
jgi:hypothetical protein